jgi:hypothetical protein
MLFKLAISAILFSSSILFLPVDSEARKDSQVKGHIKKSNSLVHFYKRKSPNKTKLDNYGTKGNINPHTGKIGRNDLFSGKGERR